MKKENAITLVSLVITIIVLLILAGITIATITGDDGLISKVKKAQEENNKADVLETMTLVVTDLRVNAEANGETYDIEYIRANINTYLVDKKYPLSNVVIDEESQTYQNILGTVDYSNKTYEFTIYWDTYKVAIGKFEGGKGNISVGSGNSYTVTINSSDTTNGIVSSGTSVVSGAILPIYAIPNAGYVFDGWEIIEGSGNATIANATSRNTQINNIVGNITVVGKFKASDLELATAAQINKGYYAYNNEGQVMEGTSEQKVLKKVTGTLDTTKGYYYTSYTATTQTPMSLKTTMKYTGKYKTYGDDVFVWPTIDTNLSTIVAAYVTFDGHVALDTDSDDQKEAWYPSVTYLNYNVSQYTSRKYGTELNWKAYSEYEPNLEGTQTVYGFHGIRATLSAGYFKGTIPPDCLVFSVSIDRDLKATSSSTAVYYKVYCASDPVYTVYGY